MLTYSYNLFILCFALIQVADSKIARQDPGSSQDSGVILAFEARNNLFSVTSAIVSAFRLLPLLFRLGERYKRFRPYPSIAMTDSPPMVGTGKPCRSNSFCVNPSLCSKGEGTVWSSRSFCGRAK